jgi:hypothetical protein
MFGSCYSSPGNLSADHDPAVYCMKLAWAALEPVGPQDKKATY